MATSKSRTDAKPARKAAKPKGTKKPAPRRAATPRARAATVIAATSTADAGAVQSTRKRGGRFAAAAVEEEPLDEAAIEASVRDKATGKKLVIVESPTKSRTLTKFLGRDFMVLASNGHVMDLPKSQLGVDIEQRLRPEYVPIRGKNQALAKIKAAARHAEHIYLAPDPDREGEAIAWHLAGQLKSARRPVQRLTFNEITERAVSARARCIRASST